MRLIVTAMKNEGPFILEWAAHHLATGFDAFLVYTNDCEDGTDAMWSRLAEMGYGAHERNDEIKARGVQKTALMRADDHPLVDRAEWLSCLDVDEFVNVKFGAGGLDDLFGAIPDADMIMMCWRRFGASGVPRFEDAFITEQFRRAAPETCPYPFHNYGFKSLWRADAGWGRIGVHRPLDPDPAKIEGLRVANGEGRFAPGYREKGLWLTPQTAGYAGVQLNHYALRSAESFLVKCDRGLPNSKVTALDLGYWSERNFNQVEDVSIQTTSARTRAVFDDLKSDPVLARLHDEAVAWHRARIEALLADRHMLKLYLHIIATESAVLPAAAARGLNPLIARSWEMERAAAKNGNG